MLIRILFACLFGCLVSFSAFAAEQPSASYDVIIRNGHIIDGTGSPWYSGSVAIRDGRIAAIGRLKNATAKTVIDAHGKVIAPGFIDMMDHSELTILVAPSLPSKIYQGITTVVAGEGDTVAPLNDRIMRNRKPGYDALGIDPTWHTLSGYFKRLEKQGIGLNFATYIGATQVRRMVLGTKDVQPTKSQLAQMQKLVAQGMRNGAVGLSSALQYAPAPFASTDELIALARTASRYGGIYATHMRSEGAQEASAVAEALRIGREADIPVEIFHLKVSGKDNWGRMPKVVATIKRARHAGIDVSSDTYAYTAWRNGLSAFLPPWALAGGRAKMVSRLEDPSTRARIKKDIKSPSKHWANDEWQEIGGDPHAVLITGVDNPKLSWAQGKRLSDVAKKMHEGPIDAVFDILVADHGYGDAAYFGMSQPDVTLALKQPWVSICTDESGFAPTGILGKKHPHPRAYGAFPRIIRKYVREDHVLTLPDAIRKMTSLPAQRMGFTQRGVIKKGMYADVVVFDPAKVKDQATYAQPNQLATGMDYVLVNGVPVIAHGKMTRRLPGKVLFGPGHVTKN